MFIEQQQLESQVDIDLEAVEAVKIVEVVTRRRLSDRAAARLVDEIQAAKVQLGEVIA